MQSLGLLLWGRYRWVKLAGDSPPPSCLVDVIGTSEQLLEVLCGRIGAQLVEHFIEPECVIVRALLLCLEEPLLLCYAKVSLHRGVVSIHNAQHASYAHIVLLSLFFLVLIGFGHDLFFLFSCGTRGLSFACDFSKTRRLDHGLVPGSGLHSRGIVEPDVTVVILQELCFHLEHLLKQS